MRFGRLESARTMSAESSESVSERALVLCSMVYVFNSSGVDIIDVARKCNSQFFHSSWSSLRIK